MALLLLIGSIEALAHIFKVKKQKSSQVQPYSVDTGSSPAPHTVDTQFDDIKKYKELLDMGVISQEEFEAKKKQLLDL